ncbi:MAG: hypothetical protein AB7O49_10165 [Sphingomonadales bacterium]
MSAAVIAFPGCTAERLVDQWQANMLVHAVRMVVSAKRIDRDAYYASLCGRYRVADLRLLPRADFVPLLRELQAGWWEVIEQN